MSSRRTWPERFRKGLNELRSHPAFPQMGRVVAYWLLLFFVAGVIVATRDTPVRHFTLIPGVIVCLVLLRRINRRLKNTRDIVHAGEDKPKGLLRRMCSYVSTMSKKY